MTVKKYFQDARSYTLLLEIQDQPSYLSLCLPYADTNELRAEAQNASLQ